MPWFKTDDGFWRHRKVRKLGREKVSVPALVACAGLWQLAGSWAAENVEHTDGFVPWGVIEDWDPRRVLSSRLLAVGLWEDAEHDGETGIRYHDWPDYNPTGAQVTAEREAATRRMALVRDPVLREALRQRDGDTCRYCGKSVKWSDRRGPLGATYDHVDPQGPGNLDNLVIACRGCNSSKGPRTPEQAGMRLIEIQPESPPGLYLDTDLSPDATDSGENLDRSNSPYPYPNVPSERSTRATRTRGDDPDFDRFWAAYPRRVGKDAARKAWSKARKLVEPREIIEGAERYAGQRHGQDPEFTAHPSTWLNAGRWDDEPPTLTAVPDEEFQLPTPPREIADDPDPSVYVRWARAQRDAWLVKRTATSA